MSAGSSTRCAGWRRCRDDRSLPGLSSCSGAGLVEDGDLLVQRRSPAAPRSLMAMLPARGSSRTVDCRRPRVAGVEIRLQGRCALLRGRVRDHPAHAARRRHDVSLDDRCAVPRRCRARTGHPGSGRPDRWRCRVCRRRRRQRSARRARGIHLLVRLRACRWPSVRSDPRDNASSQSFLAGARSGGHRRDRQLRRSSSVSCFHVAWQIAVLGGALLWLFVAPSRGGQRHSIWPG